MDYSSVKKIPFKGYARAYETTVKKLITDPDTGRKRWSRKRIIQFGEFVEDKKKLPNYHEYAVSSSKHIGTVKVTIESDEE